METDGEELHLDLKVKVFVVRFPPSAHKTLEMQFDLSGYLSARHPGETQTLV